MADDDDAYVEGFLHRTTMLLGEAGVGALASKTVAVAGCGGVGGATALTLARLGVGGFVLADPGLFDPPDANRQWAASRATLGQNKARVHADLLRQINPDVRLEVFSEGVTEDNLEAFLAPADLLLDCLDIAVPLALRGRVYRTAMEQGLYAVSAPIFGFGTLILLAEPGGMGMDELIDGFVRVASTESKLPPGFPDHYFGPHVDAVEREIHKHRVPTSGIAVTVASGLVAAEIARIFLREHYPDLEGPPVLPNVLAVEPLRRTFRVLHHQELFRHRPDRAGRQQALQAAGNDIVRLPSDAVALDLLSDSWADLDPPRDVPLDDGDVEGLLRELTGLPHVVAVTRGRLAEALLAPLVVRPGLAVATEAPFPTTRFHIEAAGGRIVDLDGLEAGDVGAVWLEPCNNALGGRPLTVAQLRAVRALAEPAGVPVVLDTARLWTNAALTGEDPRELLALADACAGSLTKEWPVGAGALIAVRDPAWLEALQGRVLMTGHGLDAAARARLAAALRGPRLAEQRVNTARELAAALEAVGAPVVCGGHGVWIDAALALPHVDPARHPDRAFANALYVEGGVRVAPNLGAPPGQRWVRCAVPVADRRSLQPLVDAVAAVLARRDEVHGLERVGGPAGVLGGFVGRFA